MARCRISDVPVEPAGNYQDSAASGVWTLEQQAYWEAQGLWPVPGNTNPDLFIENLFSTYLYTGNGSTQTITNGIDLDGEGGLVWLKIEGQLHPCSVLIQSVPLITIYELTDQMQNRQRPRISGF
jgi:hypothetical protein